MDHDAVTLQDIMKVLTANAEKAKRARSPARLEPCPIDSDCALDDALIAAPETRDPELLKKLDAVAGLGACFGRSLVRSNGPCRAR